MERNTEKAVLLRPLPLPVPRPDRSEDLLRREVRKLIQCSTPEARLRVPFSDAERLRVLPLSLHRSRHGEDVLVVLTERAPGPQLLSELRFVAGCDVSMEEAFEPETLERAIVQAYRGDSQPLTSAAMVAEKSVGKPDLRRSSGDALFRAKAAPIPQLLEALLTRAHYLAASDIHLEPQKTNVRVRFRVDGLLRDETAVRLSFESLDNLSRHLKVLCTLDLTEKRRPQDGSFSVRLREAELRLRVSFLPQHETERIVMRVLSEHTADASHGRSIRSSFTELGLSVEQQQLLLLHLGLSGGTLLFSGPTGSGKTTLLYACLEYLNEEWRSVVTIEDPVECLMPGLNQTQVTASLGFRDFLPVLLRQDPDVLMVGEIRDAETAETALTASITGHLVLSTVHAGSCFEILPRLISLGLSGLLLGSSLRLLSAQRLLGKNCPECLEEVNVSPAIAKLFQLDDRRRCYHSGGCNDCGGTGISGRRGVFELLPISPAVQEILYGSASREQAGAAIAAIKERAHEDGFRPLAFQIREAMLDGTVSPATACRALGFEPRIFETGDDHGF